MKYISKTNKPVIVAIIARTELVVYIPGSGTYSYFIDGALIEQTKKAFLTRPWKALAFVKHKCWAWSKLDERS